MTGTDPRDDLDAYSRERCLQVTLAAERMLAALTVKSADVLDGLADRPAKGRKAKARVSFREMLSLVGELRRTVRSTRPTRIVGSGSGEIEGPAVQANEK